MAIGAGAIWEVRGGVGSDTNGGGYDSTISGAGTDYSQQSSAQATGNHGTAAGTTNFADATALAFTSAMVGNAIHIAGSGLTTGWYFITGPGSTGYPTDVTLDRSPGTGTVGTWFVGGALNTVAAGIGVAVSGNTVWVKATGTYSVGTTTSLTVNNSGSPATPISLLGYSSSRGDGGQVTMQATANSITLLNMSNGAAGYDIANFILDSNSKTSSSCFQATNTNNNSINVSNCVAKNFTSVGFKSAGLIQFFSCLATAGSSAAAAAFLDSTSGSGMRRFFGCVAIANACPGFFLSGGASSYFVEDCISANNTGASSDGILITGGNTGWAVRNNICYGNGRDGLRITGAGGAISASAVMGNIFVNNGGWGSNSVTDNMTNQANINPAYDYNAYYNNTSGARFQTPTGAHDVTLSGDPFTSGSTGNFTLNKTAGAGASCRGAGYPGTLPGLTSTVGYADLGAIQSITSAFLAFLFLPFFKNFF